MIKHLNAETFEQILAEKKGAYVVDFWASWCGPCKMLAPIFEEVAEEITDVSFCKVNIDDEQELAIKLRVVSIPTILFIQDGVVVNKAVGYMDKDQLLQFVNENKN